MKSESINVRVKPDVFAKWKAVAEYEPLAAFVQRMTEMAVEGPFCPGCGETRGLSFHAKRCPMASIADRLLEHMHPIQPDGDE